MAKIERKTQKIFGSSAPADDIAVLGSFKTGTPVYSDDVNTLQNEAYEQGYGSALVANEAPFMEEQNSIPYVLSKQLAYLYEMGVPEWDAGTVYYTNSFCQQGGIIYKSKIDENTNHSPADDTSGAYWEVLQTGGDVSTGGLEILDIGIAPCGIDETKNERRYLNGQVIQQSQFPDAVQKLKTRTGWGQGGTNTPIAIFMPELVITEEEWQARLAASGKGQVGAFVIDDEAGTVRLPKVVNLQGIYDLTKAGLNVEAGLPNIELSSLGSYGRSAYISAADNGAIALSAISQNINNNGSGTGESISLDYSLKNSIYGNSDTVQQESVQYPFFIQLANSSETQINIVNEIELNNPYTLFDSKYTEAPLYNTSWLQANSAYHSKSVYVTAYEALTVENNTSVEAGDSVTLPSGGTYVKRGLAVKLSADEDITDYDFVINTADETFRLPLKTKDAPSTESLPLYFYIGETVQNANLINAGRIAEQLSVKTNLEQAAAASMPGNKYIDLTLADSGAVYTAPAAGWICVHKRATNSGQYLEIINEVSKLGLRCYNAYTVSSGQPMKVFLPVNKGDSFKVNYSASLATEYFRFVYPLGGEE